MKIISEFHKEQQIASVTASNEWHDMKVSCLLQNTYQKQPAINAYLGARYSRSADSVVDIAREITQKGIDASSRLESIFQGYGHKSVGDMADLFLCIENVPMITAMRAFNMNPVLAGQERSTRFQNFEKPNYIKIPDSVEITATLRASYNQIIEKQLNDYRELLPIVEKAFTQHFAVDVTDKSQLGALKARTFDTVRYFLPLGLKTSLGFIMSARNWSEYIGRLKGSGYVVESELGELIYQLLIGTPELLEQEYIPEADMLIRHSEPNYSRRHSYEEMKEYLRRTVTTVEKMKLAGRQCEDVVVSTTGDPVAQLVAHYLLQMYPAIDLTRVNFSAIDYEKIGRILASFHDHHNQIGNIAQTGSYQIDGYADHGILKDLNRHRSLERYVPLWESTLSMKDEFARASSDYYFLCDYLYIPAFAAINEEFRHRLDETYERITHWYADAVREIGDGLASEYTKYLLPHAHATRYRFYGSFDDMQYTANLRTRPGGHIAYRALTYRWLQLLASESPLWKGYLEKIPVVNASDREQFLNRS
jgi:thymidylate synthase ThyX